MPAECDGIVPIYSARLMEPEQPDAAQPSETDAGKLATPAATAMILLIADFPWAVSLREREPWSLAQQQSNQPHQDCAFLHDGGR